MDDFDSIDQDLEREIERAFNKASGDWPRGSVMCYVERKLPLEKKSAFTTAVGSMQPSVMKWEFKRELIENVSGFPLLHYYLLCNGDWRLIAVHGRL